MQPKKDAPQRSDAQRNRERILEVALVELTNSADAPLSVIAKKAGVGQGTFYRNFPNRETLVLEIYRHEMQQVADSATRAARDAGTRAGTARVDGPARPVRHGQGRPRGRDPAGDERPGDPGETGARPGVRRGRTPPPRQRGGRHHPPGRHRGRLHPRHRGPLADRPRRATGSPAPPGSWTWSWTGCAWEHPDRAHPDAERHPPATASEHAIRSTDAAGMIKKATVYHMSAA